MGVWNYAAIATYTHTKLFQAPPQFLIKISDIFVVAQYKLTMQQNLNATCKIFLVTLHRHTTSSGHNHTMAQLGLCISTQDAMV